MHVPVSLFLSLFTFAKTFWIEIRPEWNSGKNVSRALDHPILGPKFGPIPNAKKYGFFSQFQTKNSQFEKKKIVFVFFVLFSIFISYNTNTEHIVLHYISRKKVSLIIGINLAMETSYIRTMSNFPILVKTPRIFPIQWAAAPFPKRGVRALVS